MASTVKLKFIDSASIGEYVSVFVNTGTGIVELKETFVKLRQAKGEVTTPYYENQTPEDDPIGDATSNYISAFTLDHRMNGNVSVYGQQDEFGNLDTAVIVLENAAWQFDSVSGSLLTNLKAEATITNEPVQSPKSLELTGYVAGTDVCGDVNADFTLTGGTGTYNLYVNGVLAVSGASPLRINVARGGSKTITATDSNGTDIGSLTLRPPRKILSSDITIGVTNYESGASISIDVAFISDAILPLSYSLDGTTYKQENFFSGIADGNYTLYVKDAFGCATTKTFTVDGVTKLTETICTVSEINALRFARVQGGKKNLLNTLSYNELKQVRLPYYQKFLVDDIIPTQFKTNAKYINIYTMDGQGNKRTLTPVKETSNVGLEAKSTCTYFSLGGGRSAVYFGVVDILDPLTDAVTDTVDFGFSLPEWADEVGQLVTIDGIGQLPINNIGYSDFYDAFVIEFNVAYSGEPVAKKLYAQYNLQPYEVYQFNTYMELEPELFHVVIEAGKSATEIDFTYVSEKIKRVNDSDDLLEIIYSDKKNKGDMVYQTGIVHKLRLEGKMVYMGEQETEGYNGDTGYNVTDNSVFKTERFMFPRLSSEMAHKLRLVIAHSFLQINGILYKIYESPEINDTISTNFKTFLVSLKCGGDLFLDSGQEIIGGSAESESLSGALEASKGKSLLLWTKQNG